MQIIGYNNKEEWWLAKNSWGPAFADGGFFKIGFNAASICGDSWGLKFKPASPLKVPADKLSPSRSKPGCFEYKASSSDYVSKVVFLFEDWGLTAQQLLLDNLDRIKEPDMPLGGLTLTLCGIKRPPPPPDKLAGVKLYVRWCDTGSATATCFRYMSAATGKHDEKCYNVKPDSILRENDGMLMDIEYPVYWYTTQKGRTGSPDSLEVKELNKCPYLDGVEADLNCPGGLKFYLKWCKTKPGTMCFRFRDGIIKKDRDACFPIKPDGQTHPAEGMSVDNCKPVYWYFKAKSGQQPDLTPLKYTAYKDGYQALFDC